MLQILTKIRILEIFCENIDLFYSAKWLFMGQFAIATFSVTEMLSLTHAQVHSWNKGSNKCSFPLCFPIMISEFQHKKPKGETGAIYYDVADKWSEDNDPSPASIWW